MSAQFPQYDAFQGYIETILNQPMTDVQFKQHPEYTFVLENASKEIGAECLKCIEAQFPQVTFEDIRAFMNVNDKYGGAAKTIFTTKNMKLLYCSPTTMRYILHALLVLDHYQSHGCKQIVEVGAGYGGLFLAINHFAKYFPGAAIQHYILVDLPHSCRLIQSYLDAHAAFISVPYEVVDSNAVHDRSWDNTGDRFFVSNYAFTAFPYTLRNQYVQSVIHACEHGFMVWQTCFGATISAVGGILNKMVENVVEEVPQTASPEFKNYYVYF